ncbi:MAG: hypothetical protein HQ472_09010 [Ignavibacteria bacterium]|nr:hypothetical protein [Ignavibacteria bacterium]
MNNEKSKPVHDKVPVEEFLPGEKYVVSMNEKELYEAEVVKFHGGCWATVRVTKPLYSAMAADYTVGNEFDIKVANYKLEKL